MDVAAYTRPTTLVVKGKKYSVKPRTTTVKLNQHDKAVKKSVQRSIARTEELKFKDIYDNVAAVQSAALVAARPLVTSAQGAQDTQRIGDQIFITSVQINLQLSVSATQVMRLIVFKWKPLTTSYLPTLADILNSPTNTAVGPVYMKRIDTQQEFTILYDKCYPMQVANVSNRLIRINLSKKLGKAQFDAGTTDGLHKLYYFLLTDVAASNTVSMYNRIRYKDL